MALRASHATERPSLRVAGLPRAGSGSERPVECDHLQAILSPVTEPQKERMPPARAKEVFRRDALAAGREPVTANAIRDWREVRAGRGWLFCVRLSERARADEKSVLHLRQTAAEITGA